MECAVTVGDGLLRPLRPIFQLNVHIQSAAVDPCTVCKAPILGSVCPDPAQVQIHGQYIIRIQKLPVFCQNRTVFCDHAVAGEHQILGGFRLPGGHIDVAAEAAGRLLRNQLPPVFPLCNGLIAGREVQDHLCAAKAQGRTGRQRCPEILTELNAKADPVRRGKAAINGNRNAVCLLPPKAQLPPGHSIIGQPSQILAGGKPAFFIELSIVGHIGFRYDTGDMAIGDHHGAVKKLTPDPQGRAHHRRQMQPSGELFQLPEDLCAGRL